VLICSCVVVPSFPVYAVDTTDYTWEDYVRYYSAEASKLVLYIACQFGTIYQGNFDGIMDNSTVYAAERGSGKVVHKSSNGTVTYDEELIQLLKDYFESQKNNGEFDTINYQVVHIPEISEVWETYVPSLDDSYVKVPTNGGMVTTNASLPTLEDVLNKRKELGYTTDVSLISFMNQKTTYYSMVQIRFRNDSYTIDNYDTFRGLVGTVNLGSSAYNISEMIYEPANSNCFIPVALILNYDISTGEFMNSKNNSGLTAMSYTGCSNFEIPDTSVETPIIPSMASVNGGYYRVFATKDDFMKWCDAIRSTGYKVPDSPYQGGNVYITNNIITYNNPEPDEPDDPDDPDDLDDGNNSTIVYVDFTNTNKWLEKIYKKLGQIYNKMSLTGTSDLKNVLERIENVLENMNIPDYSEALKNIQDTIPDYSEALKNIQDTIPDYSEALKDIQDAIPDYSEALKDIQDAIPDYSEALKNIQDAIPDYSEALKNIQDAIPDYSEVLKNIQDAIPDYSEALKNIQDAIPDYSEALKDIQDAIPDYSEVLKNIQDAIPDYSEALKNIQDAIPDYAESLQNIQDAIPDYSENLEDIHGTLKSIYHQLILGNILTSLDLILDAFEDRFDNLIVSGSAAAEEVANVAKNKFPFCIPGVIVAALTLTAVTSIPPKFEVPLEFKSLGVSYTMEIDWSTDMWQGCRNVVWYFSLFLSIIGFIQLTIAMTKKEG
jgi:tetratricopeptide (TPR) repeat protein